MIITLGLRVDDAVIAAERMGCLMNGSIGQ
ncbi:hypothetical protein BN874_120114 [Candidatus Contendobacter odensis Run_B_J11]|uniref:Uncharacterized protein n=1 Tax=Candidatus Contendobacter odensis Run_B_J11 TaxID=1400861 RepID=A0A7U7J2G8_9GAMM|nr:hypothetical protein BN874_120114 [Candidatus Contendobacter odensis Run_B_J11]